MGILDFLFGKKKSIETKSNTQKKTPKKNPKKQKKEYDNNYYEVDNLINETEVLKKAYSIIKDIRIMLKNSELRDESHLDEKITEIFNKYKGDQIVEFLANFQTIEQILGVHLNDMDQKKIKFNGYEEIEQYHSLSQKIPNILNMIMLDKVMSGEDLNLGNK
tara:strand:- start:174 stop:659 length:486 start_codon:yes stop_codon:yes gene_type:complete